MQSPYYLISTCDGNTFIVDIPESPSVGEVLLLTFEGITPYGCYVVLDNSIGPATDTATIDDTFATCEECGASYTGTTVDTFYEYNNFCCDPVSGYTGTGTIYPHPEYATNGGVAIQSMSVTLGGLNGLNN
jgi:hypothetical protein